MVEAPRDRLLLIDACVVVNLYATRHMDEIVRALDSPVGIVDIVVREAGYVRRGGSGDDAVEREPIDLSPLVASGAIQVVKASDEAALQLFVDLTRELDDGEAMTAAIAISRGCAVATDDRAAIRAIGQQVPVVSTLELIQLWSNHQQVPREVFRSVLIDLRERGAYLPGRGHPQRGWWEAMMSGE